MIFFGHLGLTLGAIKIYEKVSHKGGHPNGEVPIDYRFVLAGSILPDIIDKPIGAFLFRNTFHNSRIFAHTLIVSAILIIAGAFMFHRNRKNNILILGVCSFIHLLLDSMWLFPDILFWPIFGFKFPERAEGNWLNEALTRLISDPGCFLSEVIGFLIIAYYFTRVIRELQV